MKGHKDAGGKFHPHGKISRLTSEDLEVGRSVHISPNVTVRIFNEKKLYPSSGKGFVVEKVKMPTMNHGTIHTTLGRFDSKEKAKNFLLKKFKK